MNDEFKRDTGFACHIASKNRFFLDQPISNKHNLAYSLAVDLTTLKVSKSLISALHFF